MKRVEEEDDFNSKNKGDEHKKKLGMVDRISELPEELRASILSFLWIKEAVATSILSRRWRYVWASITTLNFKDFTYPGGHVILWRCIDCVDSVVEQHRGLSIQRLNVFFIMGFTTTNSVDKLIQFAINKRVESLHLDVSGIIYYGSKRYSFPRPSLPSCGYTVSKSLKHLYLKMVDASGEDIDYLLSNCPVLELLEVIESDLLVDLRVVGPSIALRHLIVRRCNSLKTIQVCDANLVKFTFVGSLFDLLLTNVPLLAEVRIQSDEATTDFIRLVLNQLQLSRCLSCLHTLQLNIAGVLYDKKHAFRIPTFANLKHLELTVVADYEFSLCLLAAFIKASPYLHKLVLNAKRSRSAKQGNIEVKKAAHCPHLYLKVVEVAGYRPAYAVEHVVYLIENAVALEKIIMQHGEDAVQQIKEKVPSTTVQLEWYESSDDDF